MVMVADQSSPLALEVFTDAEDDSPELFILIKTALRQKKGLSQLNRLVREWWLAASSQSHCQRNIDLVDTVHLAGVHRAIAAGRVPL
jgi:hypothetical protein